MEYTNSQITALIREHIHSERDRRVLFDRFVNGMTMEKLAEKHELSVRQIRNVVYRNEQILFKHIKE